MLYRVWFSAVCITLAAAVLVGSKSSHAQMAPASEIEQAIHRRSSEYPGEFGSLARFYRKRNFAAAWQGDESARRNAVFALAALEHADDDGLTPSEYNIQALKRLQLASGGSSQADFDVLLSASVLSYMRDLRLGRVARAEAISDMALPSVAFDAVEVLEQLIIENKMASLALAAAPPHEQYALLKTALARYRIIQNKGGWPLLPGKATGSLQANDLRLSLLKQRLDLEGYLKRRPASSASLTDVEKALRRFQAATGLEQTGGLGPRTFAALNIDTSARVAQLKANMARWRWLSAFPATYVEVNAASAMLKVVDRGNVVLRSRVIAGRPETPTPVFSAAITGITFNPYWIIPDSILKKEILPKQARNPGYLASQHMAFDGPGGALRQQPGPDNALGLVKLEMPNEFNVYLHDTPARSLFRREERHLSHGCIRVEQIRPLASWVMTGRIEAAREDIERIIASGESRKITLDNTVPVYVLYWTAIADQDGMVEFRPDLYGRDRKLLAALAGQRPVKTMVLNTNCQAASAG